jgi:hypothetical protein
MNAGGVLYTCKLSEAGSNPQSSGERVSNAWITYLWAGNNPGKLGLIPHNIERSKGAQAPTWRGVRVRLASW